MPKLDKTETRFIINISGSSVQEYGEIAKRFNNTDMPLRQIAPTSLLEKP
jgi:dihydroorotate dehydrogenase (NAD+) catalytic subunit